MIAIAIATVGLAVYAYKTPKLSTTTYNVVAKNTNCQFHLQYDIDYSFSNEDLMNILKAAKMWRIASGGGICFHFRIRNIDFEEYFLFTKDKKHTIYNAQHNILQHLTFWVFGGCFLENCDNLAGLATNSGDIILSQKDTYPTALHEIGHSMGLPHSNNPDDIMYPTLWSRYVSMNDIRVLHCLMNANPPFPWNGGEVCQYEEVRRVVFQEEPSIPRSDAGPQEFPFDN